MLHTVYILSGICCALLTPGLLATPLDDYVHRQDSTYKYVVLGEIRGPGYTQYTLNMTSQTWKPELQSQPVWWHYMVITIPDKISMKGAGLLFIGEGSNTDSAPTMENEFVFVTTIIAASTGSVTAYLGMVPNQPIVFHNDPFRQERREDAIVAWTWKMFLETKGKDPEILIRMPMTKAAVRALDTVNDLTMREKQVETNRFLVAGASKRGWTTWTVGAVDKRVVAIAPIVMDLLNIQENLHHFYRSLGGWTFEFYDYFMAGFTESLDSPYTKDMLDIIDPISYNERYASKPKYIISTTGDEFFMLDDAKYYLDKLMGPTYLRMVPNADHSLSGHKADIMFGIRAFYVSVMNDEPLPQMEWKLNTTETGGAITMTAKTKPISVICYSATTSDATRKDFRLVRLAPGQLTPEINPMFWSAKPLTPIGDSLAWNVEFANPKHGWTAFFIHAQFPGHDDMLEFSTQSLIIPNTFPYPDCHGVACTGSLV